MGFLFNAINSAAKIEYGREAIDPGTYAPEEKHSMSAYTAGGTLWAELGFSAPPSMAELRELVRGRNPKTGQRLTARKHAQSDLQRRTAFFSAVLNVPKSISLCSELGGDVRLRAETLAAAKDTMRLIENEHAGFRSRKNGAVNKNSHVPSRSMGYVLYLENDSRYGDPNLHVHVFILNATKDLSDPKRPYKALSAIAVFKNQKLISRCYETELAQRVRSLGYSTMVGAEGSFEISGFDRAMIERFSKGHCAIKRAAKQVAARRPLSKDEWEQQVALKIRPDKTFERIATRQARWASELTRRESDLLNQITSQAVLRRRGTVAPMQRRDPSLPLRAGPPEKYFPDVQSVIPIPWEATLDVPRIGALINSVPDPAPAPLKAPDGSHPKPRLESAETPSLWGD